VTSHLLRGGAAMTMVGSSAAVSHVLTTGPLLTGQGLRYAAAAVLLVALARARGVRVLRPRGTEWLWLAGVAATGLVLFNVALVRGVAHAEPAVIAVAVACAPVLIAVLGPLLQGHVPMPRTLTAAVVVTAGSVLVAGVGRTDATGIAWAVVALLCEAGFTLLAVPVLVRHSPWGVSVHAVWIAALALLAGGALVEGPSAATELTATQLLALGYLAVVVTALAFVLWYGAVSGLGADRAALLCGIAPVAAAAVGVATTGQAPTLLVWAGIAVLPLGLALGLRSRLPQVGYSPPRRVVEPVRAP
jgi:drug/metabolite transporter (DMT)-like permease